MNNGNLPMKKEEGFWTKIKNRFLGIFLPKKQQTQQNVQQTQNIQQQNDFRTKNMVGNDFRTELSSAYNEKQRLYALRAKYEADENFVDQMSDDDIKALTDMYNEETAEIYRKIEAENRKRARIKANSSSN